MNHQNFVRRQSCQSHCFYMFKTDWWSSLNPFKSWQQDEILQRTKWRNTRSSSLKESFQTHHSTSSSVTRVFASVEPVHHSSTPSRSLHSIFALCPSEVPSCSCYIRPSSVTKGFTVPFLTWSSQEKWAAHKLAPVYARTHTHTHTHTRIHLHLAASPWCVKPLLILKQELNNGLHSSHVNQTPHSFCSAVRRTFIAVTN